MITSFYKKVFVKNHIDRDYYYVFDPTNILISKRNIPDCFFEKLNYE